MMDCTQAYLYGMKKKIKKKKGNVLLRPVAFDAFCIKYRITRPFIIKDAADSSARGPLHRQDAGSASESFPFANFAATIIS